MSAVIKASGFDNFRVALKDATAEQLTVTQAYWAALPGVIAEQHRHLVDEEFEVRQAVDRLEQITAVEHAHSYGMSCPVRGCRWPLAIEAVAS